MYFLVHAYVLWMDGCIRSFVFGELWLDERQVILLVLITSNGETPHFDICHIYILREINRCLYIYDTYICEDSFSSLTVCVYIYIYMMAG